MQPLKTQYSPKIPDPRSRPVLDVLNRGSGMTKRDNENVSELLNTYRDNRKDGWIIPVLFLEW